MSVFDYVNSINSHDEIDITNDYSQFIVTRHFSYFIDTVLYAAEINQYQIDNKAHYQYLFNSIRPRKRFVKWNKQVNNENLEFIKNYYNLSDAKAIEALDLLDESQIIEIKEIMTRGV